MTETTKTSTSIQTKGLKRNTIDKYYTKPNVVNNCIELIKTHLTITKDDLIIEPKKINLKNINKESAEITRSIIMLIGPLSHYFKNFSLPQSGGCKLGARTSRRI